MENHACDDYQWDHPDPLHPVDHDDACAYRYGRGSEFYAGFVGQKIHMTQIHDDDGESFHDLILPEMIVIEIWYKYFFSLW